MYGIPNCDSIKKARAFLDSNNISYEFHNYKKQGISKDLLANWCDTLGYENVLNRRGTTWRNLDEETKNNINKDRAILLMLEQPSMIKRPLLDTGKKLMLGFNKSEYQSLL